MIIIECRADITLVKCLISIPEKNIIHENKGKGGVCYQLSTNWTDSKGLIDQDPDSPQPIYVKNASSYKLLSHVDINILHDSSRNNDLIMLCPRLEDWILKSAKEAKIDVSQHGLPGDVKLLHKVLDHQLNEFRILLHIMLKRKPDRLMTLKKLLEDSE